MNRNLSLFSHLSLIFVFFVSIQTRAGVGGKPSKMEANNYYGLSVYYDFEETDNGGILDKSGNGIDGVIIGDVTLDDGQFGKAGRFANSGYLDLDGPNVPPALIPTQGFSILAWVNVETDGDQAIFSARSADTQWLVHSEVRPGGGYYRWTVRTDKPGGTIGEVKKGVPVKNEWHHFAGTYSADSGEAILYIDGEEVGRDKRDGGTVNKSWGLGARVGINIDDARPFNGRMDELSIWTTVLSQAKIKQYMADGVLTTTAVVSQHKLANTNYSYSRELVRGLNLISVPLQPTITLTAASLTKQIDSTIIIRLDETNQEFVPYMPNVSLDFDLKGASGYIVNVKQAKTINFSGIPWGIPAAPLNSSSNNWAFVLAGHIAPEAITEMITVTNLRIGQAHRVEVKHQIYNLAMTDLSRRDVIKVGDDLEIKASADRIRYRVTEEDITNAGAIVNMQTRDYLPRQSQLLQNYPNPFNPETWIPFQLAQDSTVTAKIYDLTGKQIRMVELGHIPAGNYVESGKAIYWDGKTEAGELVSSGTYFYQIDAGDYRATRKMVILK